MAHFEKKLHSEEIFHGKILRITVDTVELENGKTAKREIVHHHGGSGVVPLTADGQVYLVRQFRYAFRRELFEIPAGKLEPGEDPLETARRELMEECGLTAERFMDLRPIYPSVGYDNEIIHMYLATGLHETEAQPDEDEFLDLVKIPLDEAIGMIEKGEILDGKTVAALLKVKLLKMQES